jgi:hypothetical protein
MRDRYSGWTDAAICVALALLAAFASYTASALIDPIALDPQTGDVFFNGDTPRIFANMTDRGSSYFRTAVHPLLPLVTWVPVTGLRTIAGLEPIQAVRLYLAAAAALWCALIFILLRRRECRRADAVLFTALASSSAAAVFWFAVPETYALSSSTILLALLFVAEAERRRFSMRWFVAVNVVTMSVTLTNWMAGILATLQFRTWRQAWRIGAVALAIVTVLTISQRLFFSGVRPPLYKLDEELTLFARPISVVGMGEAATTFAVHAMVMPAAIVTENPGQPDWPQLRPRHGAGGWVRSIGRLAAGVWIALLVLGTGAFAWRRPLGRMDVVLAGTLAGQLVLHLIYGTETFLYSLHWLPLLVLLAATSTLTRLRIAALALCTGLIVLSAINNAAELRAAAEYLRLSEPARLARLHESGAPEGLSPRLPAGGNRR